MFYILNHLTDPHPRGPFPSAEAAVIDYQRRCADLGVSAPALLPSESLCLPAEVRLTLGWARDQFVVER